ncbi:intraflagellar transport protein 27 homolog [Xenia sp. Carnegie-2017]|uniref:intraflagellar transport protein 27 homolog n=1 Tax=Xenia sp. Carnegie-2017 TaxID=2897299 RepID=UPI001F044F82|nr:intraflagellar transport protein 27 homolog [Xenia sp. Carnegie-2017]XP_046855844.1 intraflagellar transport protein 27 homolog [Xenia sp. Carnegie-2017]
MVILRAKCAIAGEACVGKSALLQTFCSDGTQFPKNYTMTLGVDLLTKLVKIPETNDSVELYLFDSCGQEIYSEMIEQSWDGIDLAIVVYDVTSDQSFNATTKWIERCLKQKLAGNMIGVLIANKTDLKQRRVVSMKQGRQLATTHALEYFETSAKQNENVEAAFYYLANTYHQVYTDKISKMLSSA